MRRGNQDRTVRRETDMRVTNLYRIRKKTAGESRRGKQKIWREIDEESHRNYAGRDGDLVGEEIILIKNSHIGETGGGSGQ